MIKKSIRILFVSFIFSLQIFLEAGKLDELLTLYKRPITVLEITSSQIAYVPTITRRYKAVGIELCDDKRAVQAVEKNIERYDSLVLLNPNELTLLQLRNLTECEHFDVVIIHDLNLLQTAHSQTFLDIACKLGNYIVVQAPNAWWGTIAEATKERALFVETVGQNQAYCFQQEKRTLRKSRWDVSPTSLSSQPHYAIESTFEVKHLIKGSKKKVSPWIPGINLITGIMLNMRFPDNHYLRESIKAFRAIKHNDLVLGNMILQGKKLTLIDFADERRNAHQEKCIKAALKIFTNHRRPENPRDLLQKYVEYLHKR